MLCGVVVMFALIDEVQAHDGPVGGCGSVCVPNVL